MKRITFTLLIGLTIYGCIPCPAFAQIITKDWGSALWLSAADSTWRNSSGSQTSDTVTATGTEKYTKPFQIYSGHLGLGWKMKYSSAAADTDTVKVKLYRAPFENGPWTLVDSTNRGGRADTNSVPWMVSLSGRGWTTSWWRVGYIKLMGVPKILGLWRGND